ncbi:MAG TPA: 3-phosphoshikimate 1-carboxyvinyltransferase [Aquifex aeolicus]|uniref:3-phosphoshikimate 1-carboxyvinyltransferase n=1 Tax=Aquifex aeolicus TaxID=63363 RepID=A0A9D0YQD9_AQUAO|nr:3-phosphoshikimate 1-carboxyvinyltransferase [Aquificales bacterium]HIP98417.1 3-phosphoshikimate 1-carboxyvinyltransferase [Aquifex aeolicus]HIQ26414.1 3-phosphoshikimate 1-carboxyvinyltransferase [Aquifex aeolicus]
MKVEGTLRVPSDKSISHRAIILGSLAQGETLVRNWLRSADTLATLEIYRALGVEIEELKEDQLLVRGKGLFSFKEPNDILDAKNSGTTARLTLGVLSAQPFFAVLTGDSSLRQRPMLRVVRPLREMGANLDGRGEGKYLPVAVRGGKLSGISFFNQKASAQVKSALILAGLHAQGTTEVKEPYLSRDHTERLLKLYEVPIEVEKGEKGITVRVKGGYQPQGDKEIFVPADPSSASFFVALAVLLPGSELVLKDVLVNPTREGFFRKLKEMGANIEYTNFREVSMEPVADIVARYSPNLKGVEVKPQEIPSLIDELPLLAVVATQAEGKTVIRGAQELRVKESDRIKSTVENLQRIGAKVEELPDGMVVEGKTPLKGGVQIATYGDHRIAMAFTVAGIVAGEFNELDNPSCVAVSYPLFFEDLKKVLRN